MLDIFLYMLLGYGLFRVFKILKYFRSSTNDNLKFFKDIKNKKKLNVIDYIQFCFFNFGCILVGEFFYLIYIVTKL
jgi:hypothetical protein